MCYTEPLKCCRFWRHLTMTLTLKAKINCSSQISVCFGHSFIYIIFYTSIANNWRREALGFQVFSPSVNAYCTWRDITVLSEEISMKLCKLYIYHLSELLKRFPRSEVKVEVMSVMMRGYRFNIVQVRSWYVQNTSLAANDQSATVMVHVFHSYS